MQDYRRRKLYVDKIFQSKFLILFLTLCIAGAACNIAYLLFFLKEKVEENLYRSRIVISNVNDLIAGNVLVFNIFVLAGTTLLAVIFYLFVRSRVKLFLTRLEKTLLCYQQQDGPPRHLDIALPEEFHDVHDELEIFFRSVEARLQAEEEAVRSIKKFIDQPDTAAGQDVLRHIQKLERKREP
ncbi:MAG: hypothetical protein WCQ99_07175 [Pseudomonadota bacterium]